jgi:outer membrane protein OmpA-like peptidoglycan-associated protein
MKWKVFTKFGCVQLLFLAALCSAHAQSPQPAPAPVAPPPILSFDDAVENAAQTLFSKAQLPPGDEKVDLVIDPLIDGFSGAQSAATRLIEKRIVELVKAKFPRFRIVPFTKEALAKSPIVFVGTIRAINNATITKGTRDAYWICLRLADLKSNKIVSRGAARAKIDEVDATPTLTFSESPVWSDDAATAAYIKTCQNTNVGDPLNPAYVERINAAALISEGINEYDSKRYRESLAFYRTALGAPGGDQLRVHNGVYLANWKLNRRDDAADAFGRLVDFSLMTNKLGVRFLFKPGSTHFLDDQAVTGPYPMWLKQIAGRVIESNLCLEIVGHTSPTGPAQLNERLSALRAQTIKQLLEADEPRISERLIATGVGPKESLIGTGKDDASDALDRRVEFKVLKCG